jgi:hypothetical protein
MKFNIIIIILLLIIFILSLINFTQYKNLNPVTTFGMSNIQQLQPKENIQQSSNTIVPILYPDDYNYYWGPNYWYNPFYYGSYGGGNYYGGRRGFHHGGGHRRGVAYHRGGAYHH